MFYTQYDTDIYDEIGSKSNKNLRNPKRPQGHRAKKLRKKYDETHRHNRKSSKIIP